MMFTTPATASEPYTAEAPSLSTSMRSMMDVGMVLRSTEMPFAPSSTLEVMRRPLSSTKVRTAPMPRSEICMVPPPPLFTWVVCAPPATDGISRRIWPMEVAPERSMSTCV